MDDENAPSAFEHAILRWQKKYGISDGDPMLACLELLDIYFTARQPAASGAKPATFEEFRESLETLLQRSREFARHSGELIQRMTALPAPEVRPAGFGIGVALLLMAALIVGGLLGKFVF